MHNSAQFLQLPPRAIACHSRSMILNQHTKTNGRAMKVRLFTCLLIIGAALRIYCGSLGHNFDLQSFWLVSDLGQEGFQIYGHTSRYNYGPIWFLVIKALRHCCIALNFDNIESLHLAVSGFLSLVDAGISILLFQVFGICAALFFYLNPVSILISGFHSQFDNLSILIGLVACWYITNSKQQNLHKIVIGSLLIGASLSTKHIMLLFLPWIFLHFRRTQPILAISIPLFAVVIFCLSFIPFAHDSGWFPAIFDTLAYSGKYSNTILSNSLRPILGLFNLSSNHVTLYVLVSFITLVILSGLYFCSDNFKNVSLDQKFLFFLIIFQSLASSSADQYLAIPLVAVAQYFSSAPAWAYSLIATGVLLSSYDGVFARRLVEFNQAAYPAAQICLIALLLLETYKLKSNKCIN